MARRKHFKIDSFPKDVVEAVNALFVAGATHHQITKHLNDLGHEITKSSVGRYGKDLSTLMEKTRLVEEQAKAILDASIGTGLQMAEAASKISMAKIMEFLVDMPKLKSEEATKVFISLARLQTSEVQREKMKLVWREKVTKAAQEVEAVVKSGGKHGLSDAMAEQIKRKIQGIAA